MGKRALVAVVGFLGLCSPLFAQQTQRLDIFRALTSSVLSFPSLTLADGQLFSFTGAVAQPLSFSWMEATPPDVSLPTDVILPTVIVRGPRGATAFTAPGEDSSKEVVDVRRSNSYYAGGEVGALYGRSSGKNGVAVEQGYIIGEVGDDKFSITAGASYERTSGRVSRFGR